MTEFKIAVLDGVREYTECDPVELWVNEAGKVVLRSYNECRNNHTDVDLDDLLEWIRAGSSEGAIKNGEPFTALPASE